MAADKNSPTTVKRRGKPRGKAFRPGQSGNPAGRPRGSRNKVGLQVRQLFESVVLDADYQALFKRWAFRNELPPSLVIRMFDQVGGKPKDTVEIVGPSYQQLNALPSDQLAEIEKLALDAQAILAKFRQT